MTGAGGGVGLGSSAAVTAPPAVAEADADAEAEEAAGVGLGDAMMLMGSRSARTRRPSNQLAGNLSSSTNGLCHGRTCTFCTVVNSWQVCVLDDIRLEI